MEQSFGWPPTSPTSAFSSMQTLPSADVTRSFPQYYDSQEPQRPSKRPCLRSAGYGQNLPQLNSASKTVEAFSTTSLTDNLQSPSPTVDSDAVSGTLQGKLTHGSGDIVFDRATRGYHSHEAGVFPSVQIRKPSGYGRTSLGAAVKRVDCDEVLPLHTEGSTAISHGIDGNSGLHTSPHKAISPSDFDLDSDIECDMGKLVDGGSDAEKQQTPPVSVLEGMDKQSRDAEEYDPRLQRSPQVSRDEGSNNTHARGEFNGGDCDLLDSEVDWDEVMALVNSDDDESAVHKQSFYRPVLQHGPIQDCMATSLGIIRTNNNMAVTLSQSTFSIGNSKNLVGTASSTEVKGKSSLGGVSEQTVGLRPCFQIGELLNQGAQCFLNAEKAIFELFARVTYSSREAYARVQHFQFADLYKDYPPFISGTMRDWEFDDLLERQGRDFLGEGGPRYCRCTCKLQKDINADTGWIILILSIRLSGPDEADLMRRATSG